MTPRASSIAASRDAQSVVDLAYDETGSGPPLLLLPGLGGNALGWAPLLPVLAPRFRVIALDLRGAGRSPAPPGPYTMRLLADDAAVVLDRLGIERAHVIGFSFGGAVAQELALAYPTRVDRLVLLAANARDRPTFASWMTFFAQAYERSLDATGFHLWLMGWLFTPTFMAQPTLVEAALARFADNPYPAPVHGVIAQVAAAREHDTRGRLSQLAAETLVLVGAEDMRTPVPDAEELASGIPRARLQVMEQGGHAAFAEYPEAVAEVLLAFLSP